jgi:osmoprotectant transport system permease protein
MGTFGDIWKYIQNPYNTYGDHTQQFLSICLWSIVWAIVIAVPLGVLAAQNARIAFIASNITGLGRAVPVIAFFGFAVSTSLGIGEKPAIIALAVLGIPPILLNTIAGLQGIDPAVTDAARGMGMTWLQSLWRVRLPLVLPVIAAGVRTSAVQIVATAPLASLIGGGGYGDYILGGIGLVSFIGPAELLAGVIPVVALTLIAEFGLALVQRLLTSKALRNLNDRELAEQTASDDGRGVVPA